MKRKAWLCLSLFTVMTMAISAVGAGAASLTPPAQPQADSQLPEGWHDGSSGEVTHDWECAASGWVVDPDDRSTPVQIRVYSDGHLVAETQADRERELEQCPNGHCGFLVNLWDVIDRNLPHEITVQAYDRESEAWFDVPGTHQTLTCIGAPEGWHDGEEGVRDQGWNCNVYGWAVDPDNRDRDLTVRVQVDGSELTQVVANEARPDLEADGVCSGGTCGFLLNVYDLISQDEEHTIAVQAWDQETESWFSLNGTPKSLTCQSEIPQPPEPPYMRAFPDDDVVDGGRWPAGQSVTLSIGDDEFETQAGDDGSVWFNLAGSHDLERGELLTMYSGDVVATHTVRQVFITDVDVENQTATGVNHDGEPVHVFVDDVQRNVDTGEDSGWAADFSGYDPPLLHAGVVVAAEVFGEGGSSTIAQWEIPEVQNPFIWADPRNESISGWDWPEGESVTFELFNPDGDQVFSATRTAEGELGYDLASEGIDVEAGDRVVFYTDDITKELIVSNLAITEFDAAAKTIRGLYDPDPELGFWINLGGQQSPAISFEGDQWSATFDDFGRDMCGEAAQPDEDGDMTGIGFCTPNPRFSAYPVWDWLELFDWPIGAAVEVSIDKPGNSEPLDFHDSYTIEASDWDPSFGFLHLEIGDTYDIEIGDQVSIEGGGYNTQYTLKPLTVNPADAATNTVTGTADTGETVYVWAHEGNGVVEVTADEERQWEANLGDTYTMHPGSDGRTEVRDEVGNATTVDWHAPSTRLTVFPEQNFLEGYEWPDGATIEVTVAGKDECTSYPESGYPEWDPWNTFFSMEFPEGCTIEAHDWITLSSGSMSMTHEVQDLSVTVLDPEAHIVSGTAFYDAELYGLHAWLDDVEGSYMDLTADDEGNWAADYSSAGISLERGMCGRAELTDQNSNSTAVNFCIPNPHFTVFPEYSTLELWEWPMGAMVHLSIDNPDTEESPDFEGDYEILPADWNPSESFLWIDVSEFYDIDTGDLVEISGGGYDVSHEVRAIWVDGINADTDTVRGTADPGAEVYVWPHDYGGLWASMSVTTDENGRWEADLHELDYDIVPGSSGRAEIVDEIGNTTGIDWYKAYRLQIDIRPFMDENLEACRLTNDLIPVALLAASDFDPRSVDPDSIRFGRTGSEAEVARAGSDHHPVTYRWDVNRDGMLDVVYYFRLGDTGFSCADLPVGKYTTTVDATLVGSTPDYWVVGSDFLRLFRLIVFNFGF